ncbi:MAG: valine--tRNA ligase [Fervidicoccaceae archaeon]
MGTSEKFEAKIKEKRWDKSRENEVLLRWEKEGDLPKFDRNALDFSNVLIIDTPPPYPSGKWHVAGAAHYVQHDIIARYFRMRGYNVLLPFYADRNGLPVEVSVEKKTGLNPHELSSTPSGREKFLELCRKELDGVEKELVEILKRLGCSYEYWKDGTDSEEYRKLTQATFVDLWKRGLVYFAERAVNWCPRCRTTLSDAELEYSTKETFLYYIKFGLREGGEITVATTRPELLAGCSAVIYNPKDERYVGLKGKKAVVPIYKKEIPILESEAADPSFGTGLVMVCSYGDTTDVRLFRELNLEPTVLIDRNGRMNELSGFLKGLSISEARERIARELEQAGLLEKKEKIVHKIPICWRCGTPVEVIHVKEYFLKQVEYKEKLLTEISKMKFFPEMHRQKLIDWIKSISTDWPISRDRYYATEIPVWKCRKCGALLVPEEFRYYRPWKEDPPFERCPVCGAGKENLEGERKVFDTWFDSSISMLYVTGFKRDNNFYEKVKSSVMRPQGYEIIRTWLYYSVLRVYQLTGRMPFQWVRITGMGLDEKGEAMHKSKGNVIDPIPVIEQYGADAFRFWSAASAKVGYDYRFSPQLLRTGQLFATKLWNIARFVSQFPEQIDDVDNILPIDASAIALMKKYLRKYIKGFDEMDTFEPTTTAYEFIWNIFASHYIELVKRRAYNDGGAFSESEQKSAWKSLHTILKVSLKMIAPIMPIVTDEIWRSMGYGNSIHREKFTQEELSGERVDEEAELMELAIKVNNDIWKYKIDRGMKLTEPLDLEVYLPPPLIKASKDIEGFHRLQKAIYSEPPSDASKIGEVVWIKERR